MIAELLHAFAVNPLAVIPETELRAIVGAAFDVVVETGLVVPTASWAAHVVHDGRVLAVDELPDGSWEAFDELDPDYAPIPLGIEDIAEWTLDRTCLARLIGHAHGLTATAEILAADRFVLVANARRDLPLVLGLLGSDASSREQVLSMRAEMPARVRGVIVAAVGYRPTTSDQVAFERQGIVVAYLSEDFRLQPSLQACADAITAKAPLGTLEPESGFLLAFDARTATLGTRTFTFTGVEGAAVSVLLHAQMAGQPWVHQRSLLAEIESNSSDLKSVFKRNPAFKTLIVGDGEGRFRLQLSTD